MVELTMHLNFHPLFTEMTSLAGIIKELELFPKYPVEGYELEIFDHVSFEFFRTCHWYDKVPSPSAAIEKVFAAPAHVFISIGWVYIFIGL